MASFFTLNDRLDNHTQSGYVAAISIGISAVGLAFYAQEIKQHIMLIAILIATFTLMLAWELMARSTNTKGHLFGDSIYTLSASHVYLLRSTLFRYIALLSPWLVMNFLMQNHYHFQTSAFTFAGMLFSWLTWLIAIVGIPYIYLTLRLRGHRKYEYNDYAILLLLWVKAGYYFCQRKPYRHISSNRRSHKIILVWLVILFFLPLMMQFYNIEFTAMVSHLSALLAPTFSQNSFYQSYSTVYQFLFHLIFVIDTGIAIIAYSVSSRWLGNRVRSVDRTMGGWFVALLCYPPMNSAFTSQFIGYNYFSTHAIFDSELIQMVLWTIILALFTIYVWSTAALGFKFSNLCNRGIISSGPYQYFRHPAYTCKNVAWWCDNTYVLSSIAASLSLLAWNIIYILRGLTEERHLKQDSAYREYCRRVKGKFFFK